MRFVAISARKELTRILRDPLALLAWFLMPAIVTTLVALVFGGNGSAVPQGKLLVADQDQTFISAALTRLFSPDWLGKMILVEPVAYEAGRKRMDAGDASALLVIPKGFADAFFRNEPATLTLVPNPAQRILPRIIKETLETTLDAGFGLQLLVDGDLAKFAGGLPAEAKVAQAGLLMSRLTRQLSPYLNPPLIDVQTRAAKHNRPPLSFPALFYPGMLLLALFGMAQSMSEDVWRERSSGTMRRAMTTSHPLSSFFGGRLIALLLLFVSISWVSMGVAGWALSAPPQNWALASAWLAGCGVGLYLMAVLLQVFSTEQRAGAVLNGFVLFLLSMIGGTFFPFEIMPAWLARIGRFTPNGWAITRFKEMISGPVDPARVAVGFAVLAAFIAITFLFLTRRFRRWAV